MEDAKDLCIERITAAYELTTLTWSRPKPVPKYTNTIAYFREGCVTYHFEDETITAHAGDLLVLPRGVVYSGQKVEDKNSYYVIEFDVCGAGLERLGLRRIMDAPKGSRERFRRMLECWNNGDTLLCRGLLYELLHTLVDRTPSERTVAEAIALMKHRLADADLSLADLCAASSVSESQLRRLFHQETGRSPMQYLSDLRISQARSMLLQADISIGEVAEFCGYSSLFYFSRDFKKKTGMTPSQYREGR